MSLYRKIFKQALDLTWRNKYFWFFGLFAAFMGNGGDYQILTSLLGGESTYTFRDFVATNVFSGQSFVALKTLLAEQPLTFAVTIVIGLLLLALICFFIWLSVMSQAALVKNSADLIAGKKTDFQAGVTSGGENFWPVLALNILAKILIAIAFAIVGLPLALGFGRLNPVAVNFLYLIAFLIFIPLAIALSFSIKYAIAYKVIKGDELVTSIQKGWQLFYENWLVSVEMALALFFISFVFGLAVLLSILVFAVPLLFLAFVFYYLTSFVVFWIIITLSLLIFLVIIVLTGSMLTGFLTASWTGLFVELSGKGGVSKIVRLVNNFTRS